MPPVASQAPLPAVLRGRLSFSPTVAGAYPDGRGLEAGRAGSVPDTHSSPASSSSPAMATANRPATSLPAGSGLSRRAKVNLPDPRRRTGRDLYLADPPQQWSQFWSHSCGSSSVRRGPWSTRRRRSRTVMTLAGHTPADLESVLGATPREFESRILRARGEVCLLASPTAPQLTRNTTRGDDAPEPPGAASGREDRRSALARLSYFSTSTPPLGRPLAALAALAGLAVGLSPALHADSVDLGASYQDCVMPARQGEPETWRCPVELRSQVDVP